MSTHPTTQQDLRTQNAGLAPLRDRVHALARSHPLCPNLPTLRGEHVPEPSVS